MVTVDVIPPMARYVIYAKMELSGPPLDAAHAKEAGHALSESFEQLISFARERGGNFVVLLSNEHGIDLPIQQCSMPLRLRSANPVVVAVIFKCDEKTVISELKKIEFTTRPPTGEGAKIAYTIDLKQNTAGVDMAYWTYGNISRFVADAREHDFDTVVVEDTEDREWDPVPLPGCDQPAKISRTSPKLVVTIFKKTPNHSPEPAPGAVH